MPSETRERLTDAEIGRAIRTAVSVRDDYSDAGVCTFHPTCARLVHAGYALAQSRASERIDAAREREREALTKCARWLRSMGALDRQQNVEHFRDREYPAPRPAPKSVTLEDGRATVWYEKGNKFPWRSKSEGSMGEAGHMSLAPLIASRCLTVSDNQMRALLALSEAP